MIESAWPLIYIQWVDAYDLPGSWHSLSDIDDLIEGDWAVEQVGWLYEETDNYIVIINMVSENSDSFSHATKIPKPWVLHREELHLKGVKKKKPNP